MIDFATLLTNLSRYRSKAIAFEWIYYVIIHCNLNVKDTSILEYILLFLQGIVGKWEQRLSSVAPTDQLSGMFPLQALPISWPEKTMNY